MDYFKSLKELRREYQSYHSFKLRELYDMWYKETFGQEELNPEYRLNLLKLQKDFVKWVIETNPNNVVTKIVSGWEFGPVVCLDNHKYGPIVINSAWAKDERQFTGDSYYHIPYKLYRNDIWYTIFTVEHWPELIPFSKIASEY